MPVDPANLRRIVEHNEKLTESVKHMKNTIRNLKVDKREETSECAVAWARNVEQVLFSLKGQQQLSRQMRESARVSDEEQSEQFRDRYRFLVDRLKGEVRSSFRLLKEYVDLPQDFQRQRTWNDCIYDMEVDLKLVGSINAGEHGLASVDPLVALLNYSDKVVTHTLSGILFQKAVLDWDLKNERDFADGPTVEMAEKVVNIFSKTESIPAKLRLQELPKALEAGPFTFVVQSRGDVPNSLTPLQRSFIALMHEVDSLDKGLRHMKFAERVHMDLRDKSTGKDSAVDELRKELVKWSDKCTELQESLRGRQHRKTAGGMEKEAEKLADKIAEKEQMIKEKVTALHKLEGDWQSLKYDMINQRREKNELTDKINRMSKENVPMLEKMKLLLGRSQQAVEQLVSDAAVLSETYRQQVRENAKIEAETETMAKEILSIQAQLKEERRLRKLKEEAVTKKESMYLRTMAARRCIQESCAEQDSAIAVLDGKTQKQDQEISVMCQAMEEKNAEIATMLDELQRARKRAEELRQQQAACAREYEAATGLSGDRLLDRFRKNADAWSLRD